MAERVIDLNRHIPNEVPHLPTYISESRQDTVSWECEEEFEITDITPRNPFFRDFPALATLSASDHRYRLNSGPTKPNSKGTHYHSHFRTTGRPAAGDPDIIVDA